MNKTVRSRRNVRAVAGLVVGFVLGVGSVTLAQTATQTVRLAPGQSVMVVADAAPTTTVAPTTTRPPVVTTSTTLPPTTSTSTTTTSTTVAPTASTTTTTAPPVTTTTPPHVHYGLPVNTAAIPAPATGFANSRIVTATYQPFNNDIGAFRVNCSRSHMNFDDPIVYPGQVGRTHLHTFYGNTGANASSNTDSLLNSGNSTCTGGIENRSAYWVPSMIDTATNRPIDQSAGTQLDRENALQVYYKTGYEGVPSRLVQNFPRGLRIVAGNASATTPTSGRWITTYHCEGGGPSSGQLAMPNCPAGALLVMSVKFPQCWNGRDLDSPNHQSHMSYGTGWTPVFGANGSTGCPSTHPVPLPEITQLVRYRVPAAGMSTWRLSSDTYAGPAGYSGHADWWNGWHEPTFQSVVDNCYLPSRDCRMNLLGDGRMLN